MDVSCCYYVREDRCSCSPQLVCCVTRSDGMHVGRPDAFPKRNPTSFGTGSACTHHFTVPYFQWSNGAVERLGKKLLRVIHFRFSEVQHYPTEWPQLTSLVQIAINKSPSPEPNNVTAIIAFTGHPPSKPVSTFLQSHTSGSITISDAQCECAVDIDSMIKDMDHLHPLVEHSFST